jgi:fatty acid desaturase
VTALVSTFTTLPFNQLRRNRHFYLQYDGFYLVLCTGALAAMLSTGWQPLVTTWRWEYLLLTPVAIHLHILCNVYVHNCTHRNFPRPINRLVGELCGFIVLTRFASWEVLHQRHHQHSDDVKRDPHPVERSYWRFFARSVSGIESQLQNAFYDLYGDTPENRAYQARRAYVSYFTNLVAIAMWFVFLGPIAFVAFFVPAQIVGWIHVMHFNWSTHNAKSPSGDYKPVNLDHGFFWVGNRIWHGIYFHGNHHKKPTIFNPKKLRDSGVELTVPPYR